MNADRVAEDVAEILVVCLGNICRSPFAEVLLAEEARRRIGDDAPIFVHSAGLRGLVGHGAPTEMCEEASSRGLDLSGHRGAEIHPEVLREADLVLTMTESQRDRLLRLVPAADGRVFTLKEFARLCERLDEPPARGHPAERVREVARRVHGLRPLVPAGEMAEDVEDPYGGPREGYAETAQEIDMLVATIAPVLFGDGA